MTRCARCGTHLPAEEAECCWYCLADLCVDCWDKYGHCGHSEAEAQNEQARQVEQPTSCPHIKRLEQKASAE